MPVQLRILLLVLAAVILYLTLLRLLEAAVADHILRPQDPEAVLLVDQAAVDLTELAILAALVIHLPPAHHKEMLVELVLMVQGTL